MNLFILMKLVIYLGLLSHVFPMGELKEKEFGAAEVQQGSDTGV